MKTIQEQIKVMQHFDNGGNIEFKLKNSTVWSDIEEVNWNWYDCDYRIKEQKKTITIEKWLVQFDDNEYRIMHSFDIEKITVSKIKLLETYEVEI